MPCVSHNPSDMESEPFVEVDPTGRYGRYEDLLGSGSIKKIYRAFDKKDGKEVAWNQVLLRKFIDNEEMIKNLFFEVELLRTLNNKNILTSFGEWFDRERCTLNCITEVCTSGNLRDYRRKHRGVSIKAVKKWLRQILKGLEYLHMHEPCIIHRDLNCSNIFINGSSGQIKIGDLGYATAVGKTHVAHSMVGTPEFMAPEVYEENYTEAADIYAFGMCVLELVTLEIPYSECDHALQIYQKVMSGARPRAMNKVKDPEVKKFIEKCLTKQLERPSASELLKDPFFDGLTDDDDDENYMTRLELLFSDVVHIARCN